MSERADSLVGAVLKGTWGHLRPLNRDNDASQIYARMRRAEAVATWRELEVGPFHKEGDFVTWVDQLLADPTRATFAVVDTNKQALGWLCLMNSRAAHRSVELGCVLYAPELQRTPLATEAFYLAIAYAFETLKFWRMEWACTAENLRARRAAERLGFKFEGILRSKRFFKGAAHDIATYSLLAPEWPHIREAMERWLAPSNFAKGVQRKPLAARRLFS
jgi:RimJ/RimL family protein N-acetyltransferase